MRRLVVLVLFGLLLGAGLTAAAGALSGSPHPDAVTWLSTVATVAALVVAVGIFRVQQTQSDAAHQELIDALKAQDEILEGLADAAPPSPSPASADAADALTSAQQEALEARFGDRAVDAAWQLGPGRGNRSRLVRLQDGTLVTVFTGRGDRVRVHEVGPRADRGRQARERRSRGRGPTAD